jgi:probable H4MPT-linked C1 transfer pathway protein
MATMTWLGLDIGGANLKAADAAGYAMSRAFALWRAPERLADELRSLLAEAPPHPRIAATMTAELADCFATKADGVRAVVEALVAAADGREVRIYTTRGELLRPVEAVEQTLAVAASNWHALATVAAQYAAGETAVLLDIGSTTADLIPLVDGRPAARGTTDPERLLAGELVYAGVERTPVGMLVSTLPSGRGACPVARELFATTRDAYLLLGELPEEPHDCDTADGRPATREAAHSRLARMVCADATSFSEADALASSAAVRAAQMALLRTALQSVTSRLPRSPSRIILSGHGEFLARALVDQFSWPGGPPEVLSLNKILGPERSRCAPAYALAVLADERLGNVKKV